MPSLDDAEERMKARATLRDGYRSDVLLLAEEMVARIKRGEFDHSYPWFHDVLDGAILGHRRVTEEMLALELIMFSENRNAIESDFLEGLPHESGGPWARFEGPFDPESGMHYAITLPSWTAIAYHALWRDVQEQLYSLLGDSPEQYIATRMGHFWE
jgi:hypothetical protein